MHNKIDKLGIAAIALALIAAFTMMLVPRSADAAPTQKTMGYEDKLFDTSYVHTIDIKIEDWEGFIDTARSEEYSLCSVTIDGHTVNNVGIRGKGNTSLSSVSSMNSDRYSFKIEFDQYESSTSYYGLDKLSLNNLIQDNTLMKDYLTYRLMNEFGAAAPLCSYAYLTVNGEDWGLYLAVEAVEESFLQRNYGTDYGDLYKPDSMQMGGGRGNGRDFDMNDFMDNMEDFEMPQMPDMSRMPDRSTSAQDGEKSGRGGFDRGSFYAESFDPGSFDPGSFDFGNMGGGKGDFDGFGGFGMGSSDVKLQYAGDDVSSYSTIFNSAKTTVTKADQQRLIEALKNLSGDDPTAAVDAEAVLRYFVVHNYVVNGDSYTGSMVHNYYLYEEDGRLSMIPWDYNLAYGTFMGGSGSSSVNDDIDLPLSTTGSDRPMYDWIVNSEEALAQYHALFEEFLATVDVQGIIDHAYALIAPYVDKDPTKFCTTEEFHTGVETLKEFCALRSQSVSHQLSGSGETVDASCLNTSAMGSMGGGGGFGGGDRMPGRGQSDKQPSEQENAAPEQPQIDAETSATPQIDPSAMEGFDPSAMPGGMGGFDPSAMEGFDPSAMPGGMGDFDPSAMEGFDPNVMPGGMGGFDPSAMPGGMGGFDPSAMSGGKGGFERNAADSSLQPMSMGGFDPNAMPGGMGGMQMPDAVASATPEAEEGSATTQAGTVDSQRPQQGFDRGNSGGFGGMQMPTNAVTSNILPLVLSLVVMVAALVFAFCYKR